MNRTAFTMVEVVFVILILGILAAVAIPRLSTTRDDARVSNMSHLVMMGAHEIASYAVANGKTEDNLSAMSNSIEALLLRGDATLNGEKSVGISMGGVVNCLVIEVNTSATSETLILSANGTGLSPLCDLLQNRINLNQYPMLIRGESVNK
jgi:general secretion pathway protein G